MARAGGSDWPGKHPNYYGFSSVQQYPFKVANYCGLQDSLFWELSNVATMQGKLSKKTEISRKQEIWREGWYILVKKQLWVFPIPTHSTTNNYVDRNDPTICPVYYYLGGDATRGITMVYRIDATTFSIVINNHSQNNHHNLQVFASSKTSMTKQTQTLIFHTKSTEETSVWIEKLSKALHAYHAPISQNSSSICMTDFAQDNDMLGSVDFMIEQSQSERTRQQVRSFEDLATLSRALPCREVREGFEHYLARRRQWKEAGRLWLCWQFLADLALYQQCVGLPCSEPNIRSGNKKKQKHRERVLRQRVYLPQAYLPDHVREWLGSLFHHFLAHLMQTIDPQSESRDEPSEDDDVCDAIVTSVAFQSALRRLEDLLQHSQSDDTTTVTGEMLLLFAEVQQMLWQMCERLYSECFLASTEGYDLMVLRDHTCFDISNNNNNNNNSNDNDNDNDDDGDNGDEEEESEQDYNSNNNNSCGYNQNTTNTSSTSDNAMATAAAPSSSSVNKNNNGNSSGGTAIFSWITSPFRTTTTQQHQNNNSNNSNTNTLSSQSQSQSQIQPHPSRDSVTRWRESLWQACSASNGARSPHSHTMTMAMTSLSDEQWWQLVSCTGFTSTNNNKNAANNSNTNNSNSNVLKKEKKTVLDWLPIHQEQWLHLYSSSSSSASHDNNSNNRNILSHHLPSSLTENNNNNNNNTTTNNTHATATNTSTNNSTDHDDTNNTNNNDNTNTNTNNTTNNTNTNANADDVNDILDELLSCELAYTAQDTAHSLHSLYSLHHDTSYNTSYNTSCDTSPATALLSALAHTQLRNAPGLVLLAANMRTTFCPGPGPGVKETTDTTWHRRSFSGDTGNSNGNNGTNGTGTESGPGGYVRGGSFSSFRPSPRSVPGPSSVQNNYDNDSDTYSRRPSLSGPSSGPVFFPPESASALTFGPTSPLFPPGQAQRQIVLLTLQFGQPALVLCDPVRGNTNMTVFLSAGLRPGLSDSLYSFTLLDDLTGKAVWQFTMESAEDFTVENQRISFNRWCSLLARLRALCSPVLSPDPSPGVWPCVMVVKRGYLQKRGRVNTAYQWRYLELSTDWKLRYYRDHEATRQFKGAIDLHPLEGDGQGCEVVRRDKEVVLRGGGGGVRVWYLRAEEEAEASDWLSAIQQLVAWRALVMTREHQQYRHTIPTTDDSDNDNDNDNEEED